MLTTEKKTLQTQNSNYKFPKFNGIHVWFGVQKKLGPLTSWFQNMNLVVFPIIF